eukprot:7384324-Karenia_brevis.AAC.1
MQHMQEKCCSCGAPAGDKMAHYFGCAKFWGDLVVGVFGCTEWFGWGWVFDPSVFEGGEGSEEAKLRLAICGA